MSAPTNVTKLISRCIRICPRLKYIGFHSKAVSAQLRRWCSTSLANTANTDQNVLPWQLVSAVCLQRTPVITTELCEAENDYSNLMHKIEFENSLLSNHELRHIQDLELAEKRKSSDLDDHESDASLQTALEIEDVWEAEHSQFTSASRITAADEKNDIKSPERKLDDTLVLIVKQKLGDTTHWMLPQGQRHDGESMRKAAERVLQHHCGEDIDSMFVGNAPCGFYKYRFPHTEVSAQGAKVFFFKAQYRGGTVETLGSEVTDYLWVTLPELKDYFSERYLENVEKFLINI